MGVPRAGCVRIGGRVRTRWTHGWRHMAVVMEQWAVSRVWGCRLRSGWVGTAQQRCCPSIYRFVGPEVKVVRNKLMLSRTANWNVKVWQHMYYSPAAPPLSRSKGHPSPAGAFLIFIGLVQLNEGCVWQVLHLRTKHTISILIAGHSYIYSSNNLWKIFATLFINTTISINSYIFLALLIRFYQGIC